jgi:hypothetical protein
LILPFEFLLLSGKWDNGKLFCKVPEIGLQTMLNAITVHIAVCPGLRLQKGGCDLVCEVAKENARHRFKTNRLLDLSLKSGGIIALWLQDKPF